MPPGRSAPIRLLVVENDPVCAGLLKGCLRLEDANGLRVEWAPTLEEAVRQVKTGEFEAILLSLTLPGSPGFGALEKMLQVSPVTTPILALTPNDDIDHGADVIRHGAQEVILRTSKFDGKRLLRRIVLATERMKHQRVALSTAFKDDLTGLDNRAFFLLEAERELEIARRRATRHSLIILREIPGIDVSETMAAEANRAAIPGARFIPDGIDGLHLAIALLLRRHFRHTDLVARLDQTTFAVLALDSDVHGSRHVRKRLGEYIDDLGWVARTGVAVYFPESNISISKLMEMAEAQMNEKPASPRDEHEVARALRKIMGLPPVAG